MSQASQSVGVDDSTETERFVEVRALLGDELSDLELEVLCSRASLGRRITNPRVQKPGLAFAGHYDYIRAGRVQILGESETAFLDSLGEDLRNERFARIARMEIPVFVITKGIKPLPGFLRACRTGGLPVLASPALSWRIIRRISYFLEDHLMPSRMLHAVLIDIYGLGVLLVGSSGVGKSEAALDLITRGHSLVADDQVVVRRYPHGELIGYAHGQGRHMMELRGLGIINVKDLFGLAAVRERKTVDLVIELEPWEEGKVYDRLGLDETVFTILDTRIPYIRMPIATGRNVANLVEIAARNHVLKLQGHHSARAFVRQLEKEIAGKRSG